jgi:L-arabinose isomerase
MKSKPFLFLIVDLLITSLAFLAMIWIKPASKSHYLPLYLKLYDELVPEARIKFSEFNDIISEEFEKREIKVVNPGICCVEDEFKTAVALFEKEKVDAIVTLHLAYSPSLESSKVLANTKIPIVVLDTTYDFSFSPVNVNDELIMMNHGIHGVQDMCNLLLRNNKPFQIEAGHWKKSNVIQRVISDVRTAKMASFMKNVRVGIIGKQFKGMGDFQIPFDKLKENIGIDVVQATPEKVSRYDAIHLRL